MRAVYVLQNAPTLVVFFYATSAISSSLPDAHYLGAQHCYPIVASLLLARYRFADWFFWITRLRAPSLLAAALFVI